VLLAFLTFPICFTAVVSVDSSFSPCFGETSHVEDLTQFSAYIPLVLGTSLPGNSSHPLEQSTIQEIYRFIKDNPGVPFRAFRGICSALHLSIGVVQYHKKGRID